MLPRSKKETYRLLIENFLGLCTRGGRFNIRPLKLKPNSRNSEVTDIHFHEGNIIFGEAAHNFNMCVSPLFDVVYHAFAGFGGSRSG